MQAIARQPAAALRGLRVWLAIWIIAVVAGAGQLMRYQYQAGEAGAHPATWPAGSILPRAADRPTLLLFSHPMCPCTRASLNELAVLLTRFGDRVSALAVLRAYPDLPATSEASQLRRQAEAIPGLRAIADADGRESRRFGAATSGQVLLYDTTGRLLYAGGITAARGHEGANTGRSSLEALIDGRAPAPASLPVFGCPLEIEPSAPEPQQ